MINLDHGLSPQDAPLLSPHQARLLFAIANNRTGISVTELAEIAHITPGAVTQFINALVKKNCVRRSEDFRDRRIVRLMLTESAQSQFEKMKKHYLTAATQIFNILSDEDIQQISGLLAKVNYASVPEGIKMSREI